MNLFKKIFAFLIILSIVFPSFAGDLSEAVNKEDVESVVKISYTVEGRVLGSATGFSIDYDKEKKITYILTNAHVCEKDDPAGLFLFQTSDNLGGPSPFDWLHVVEMDKSKDLCLMRTSRGEYIKPLKISNKDVETGDKVSVIGAPRGIWPILTDTYVSGFIRRPGVILFPDQVMILSQMILPGHSGSPVLNENGEVVGVVYATYTYGGVPMYGGLAVSLDSVRSFLEKSHEKRK